jgi:hypothetical protein
MSTAASTRPAIVGTLVWLVAATLIGASGALAAMRAGPLVLGVILTIIAIAATTQFTSVRSAVDAIPLRILIGIHALRFIGIAFLVLSARGELSPVFGQRAGWGDVVVAAIAVVLAVIGVRANGLRRRAVLAWNTLGMLDLLLAVATAGVIIARGDSPGMDPLLRLPLILVPIFAVPVLLATHMAVFRRLLRS